MFESSNSKLKICNGFCLKSSPQSLNLGNKSNQTVLSSCCIWVCTMSQSIQYWSSGLGGALLERKFLQLIRKCFCDIFSPQVTLQDQQRETSLLAKRLGLAAKENQDLAEWVSPPNIVFETICSNTKVSFSLNSFWNYLFNHQGLFLLILFLKLFALPPRCATAEPDMKGKVVYEVDDPNRPRCQIFV